MAKQDNNFAVTSLNACMASCAVSNQDDGLPYSAYGPAGCHTDRLEMGWHSTRTRQMDSTMQMSSKVPDACTMEDPQ